MKNKFTLDYLRSIPKDEFIHWTGVHIGPGTGKWGFNKGHVWNNQLLKFLNYHPTIRFIDYNEEPYMSRYFNNDIIVATNQDFGILRVTNMLAKGVDGVLINHINNFISKHKLNNIN